MHDEYYFWFDRIRCDTFGVRLQSPVTFDAPVPRVNTVTVAGRNGDLKFFDGSYENVIGNANCFALEESRVDEALNAISKWMFTSFGYHRLETSNEPDYFRLANLSAGLNNDIRRRILAPFTLSFDCKPQKFLKSGERTKIITKSGTVIRNQGFPAKPLITIYGSGTAKLQIGDYPVEINTLTDRMTLDCDTQNAYKGPTNENMHIHADSFPILDMGENEISWTGGIERVEIVPRWWTL